METKNENEFHEFVDTYDHRQGNNKPTIALWSINLENNSIVTWKYIVLSIDFHAHKRNSIVLKDVLPVVCIKDFRYQWSGSTLGHVMHTTL